MSGYAAEAKHGQVTNQNPLKKTFINKETASSEYHKKGPLNMIRS